jgi:hypothetical protein
MSAEKNLGPLPGSLDRALQLAWNDLESKNLAEVAANAGADMKDEDLVLMHFVTPCVVSPRERSVTEKDEELAPPVKLLVLHYLLGCDARMPVGRPISFAQAPSGNMYFAAYKPRVIDRLAEEFGADPQRLEKAGEKLGAERLPMGDASVRLRVFPKMPVIVTIWKGDSELPASATLLFDELAPEILPTEDLAVLGAHVVQRLRAETLNA